MKGLFCGMALLCSVSMVGQERGIIPLSIGDGMPDIPITHIINHPVSTIQLSSLHGKLVILDFWNAWCSSCIQAFPAMDSLQELYRDRLQIITVTNKDSAAQVCKALGRYPKTRNNKLPIVIGDTLLRQYFPHELISHVAWIDPSGIVRAITGSDYVTGRNILTMLESGAVDWPVKRDIFYDPTQPLLSLSNTSLTPPRALFFSAFTAYLDGISPPNGTLTDSSRKVTTTSFYNYDLLSYCEMALDYTMGATRDRFILQVKDTGRFVRPRHIPISDWRRLNTWCYNLQLPMGLSAAAVQRTTQQDLLAWLHRLGINVRRITSPVGDNGLPYYLITDQSDNRE